MKALTKLLTDFVTWRWAPAVGLLSASLLYVLVVVGLIPTEIGVPVANAKFAPRSLSASTLAEGAATPETASTSDSESAPAPAPVTTHHSRSGGQGDFGRRGFSPPLERPDPPPAPVVIPPPPPVVAAAEPAQPEAVGTAPPPATPPAAPPGLGSPLGGRLGGMFQGISGALRARGYAPNAQAPSSDAPAAPPAEGQTPPGQAAPGQTPPGQAPPAGQPPTDGAEAKPVPPPQ